MRKLLVLVGNLDHPSHRTLPTKMIVNRFPKNRAIVLLIMSTLSTVSAFLAVSPLQTDAGLLRQQRQAAFPISSRGGRISTSGATSKYDIPTVGSRHSLSMKTAGPLVKKVAIVGAGIGGLTLANALLCKDGGGDLRNSGVEEVSVFEKFDSVKPGVGGGVQINSGAVVLARLGLGEAIKVCRDQGVGGVRGGVLSV